MRIYHALSKQCRTLVLSDHRWLTLQFELQRSFRRQIIKQSFKACSIRAELDAFETRDFELSSKKSKTVFLGTPEVAAKSLSCILDASTSEDSIFDVVAIVTQPPSKRGRGHKLLPSPVGQLAELRGFPSDCIFTPQQAREADFLSSLSALQPDLCITAAYGNFLPSKFLQIPAQGTVNIHPSLLPLYRGASPVQRAIEDGVAVSGVTVAYTVLAMDAGPIIAQQELPVDPTIKAPQLLELLFGIGTSLLIECLPRILNGSARAVARSQDDSLATHARKVTSEEGILDFSLPARVLHNKIRAFAGWPGTRATFLVQEQDSSWQEMSVKVISSRQPDAEWDSTVGVRSGRSEVVLSEGALCVCCGDGLVLKITEIQPPSKQVMDAKSFWNGLRGRKLRTGVEVELR